MSIVLVSLHQEKSFDCDLHVFMGKVLQRFGFGELFSCVTYMYLSAWY